MRCNAYYLRTNCTVLNGGNLPFMSCIFYLLQLLEYLCAYNSYHSHINNTSLLQGHCQRCTKRAHITVTVNKSQGTCRFPSNLPSNVPWFLRHALLRLQWAQLHQVVEWHAWYMAVIILLTASATALYIEGRKLKWRKLKGHNTRPHLPAHAVMQQRWIIWFLGQSDRVL